MIREFGKIETGTSRKAGKTREIGKTVEMIGWCTLWHDAYKYEEDEWVNQSRPMRALRLEHSHAAL